ncbi:MAG: hypothetical protein H0W64_03805 [Gammaproteobacteria bacterium]|nr:hypothetical protein [Gammaproteobacteria bacterium]
MKKTIKIFSVLLAAGLVAGCVEDQFHSNGYYSSGSAPQSYYSDATSGYNQNYHSSKGHRKNNGYYSKGTVQSRLQGPPPVDNGYHSTGQNVPNGGYSSTNATQAQSGYGSSSSNATSSQSADDDVNQPPVNSGNGYYSHS